MFWNRRAVRITIGLLLLGAALLAVLPALTGYTSLDGTVNARFAVITAPIDGSIVATPPKVGTPLAKNSLLTAIQNERVNRAVAVSLAAELETVRDRLAGLNEQRHQLAQLGGDLQTRVREYQQASIRMVEQQIAAARERIGVNEAQQTAADAELTRRQTLWSKGIVAGSQLEQARAAMAASTGERSVIGTELERLDRQLEALKNGVYVGDSRNDVPYSRQRLDEITIQIADIDARIKENSARFHQLQKQLIEEQSRITHLERADIRMPYDGVIWRNGVVEASNVVVGSELTRILDCRNLFVDILVSEVDYDEIYAGRSAQVRLLGRGAYIEGEVTSVRGSSAVVEEPILAAIPPQSAGRNARIRVTLAPSELNEDYKNFCQVGRTVQVRFQSRSLPVKRWIQALWFSLT